MTETFIDGLFFFLIGLALIGLEAVVISFGLLLLTGLIIGGYGFFLLMQDPVASPIFGNPALLAGILVGVLGLVALSLYMVFRAYRHKTQTGREGMIGHRVIVHDWAGTQGTVLYEGEQWKAKSPTPLQVTSGEELTITTIDGMVLNVSDHHSHERN